ADRRSSAAHQPGELDPGGRAGGGAGVVRRGSLRLRMERSHRRLADAKSPGHGRVVFTGTGSGRAAGGGGADGAGLGALSRRVVPARAEYAGAIERGFAVLRAAKSGEILGRQVSGGDFVHGSPDHDPVDPAGYFLGGVASAADAVGLVCDPSVGGGRGSLGAGGGGNPVSGAGDFETGIADRAAAGFAVATATGNDL